jgi:IS1 family transposase
LGDRSTQTLQPLIEKIDPYLIHFYYADHWKSYPEVLAENQLSQSKAETHGIERNNSRQRHWFARFKRRSIVVSKSLQMVEATMVLFVYFQKKENLHKLISLIR